MSQINVADKTEIFQREQAKIIHGTSLRIVTLNTFHVSVLI